MEWRQIEAFYSLVRLGSMTRAAEVQYRTQSALSQQISRLEDELGCQLLERIGKKSFTLTSAGKEFYVFAEHTLNKKKQFVERIKEISDNSLGSISIAAPTAVLYFLLPNPLKKYASLYPNVHLHIIEKFPQDCLDLLKKGQIDFGVVHGSSVPKYMKSFEWIKGRFKVAVSKGHELCSVKKPTIEQLANYHINIAPQNLKLSARERLDKKFEEMGLSYTVGLESPSCLSNLKYTSLGFGVTFLMCYGTVLDEYFCNELTFIDMDHIFPDDVLSIVTRSHKSMIEFKKQFVQTILDECLL